MTIPDWALALPWNMITKYAKGAGLSPLLLAAIVQQESGGNRSAARYEPGWKWFFKTKEFAKMLRITEDTERVHQATSWGYAQVMGAVARELGYRGNLPELGTYQKGLYYGALKLKECLDKYGDIIPAISAYNAGHPSDKNKQYVQSVLRYYKQLGGEL